MGRFGSSKMSVLLDYLKCYDPCGVAPAVMIIQEKNCSWQFYLLDNKINITYHEKLKMISLLVCWYKQKS